jgi:carboxylate-amine ligase
LPTRDRRGRGLLGATGTHPFSSWQDQRIIDTPHYPPRRRQAQVRGLAQQHLEPAHIHIGIRGIDRAIAVCDAMRAYLPHLLALSANSPCIDGVWTHLHSARTQTFVRMFPRCGIPDIFGTWAEQRRYFELLFDTDCDPGVHAGLVVACARTTGTAPSRCASATCRPRLVADAGRHAAGRSAWWPTLAACLRRRPPLPVLPETRWIEENLWRAIRYGLDGKLVDWDPRPARCRRPTPSASSWSGCGRPARRWA